MDVDDDQTSQLFPRPKREISIAGDKDVGYDDIDAYDIMMLLLFLMMVLMMMIGVISYKRTFEKSLIH